MNDKRKTLIINTMTERKYAEMSAEGLISDSQLHIVGGGEGRTVVASYCAGRAYVDSSIERLSVEQIYQRKDDSQTSAAALDSRIAGIEADYLKRADKTELQGEIAKKADAANVESLGDGLSELSVDVKSNYYTAAETDETIDRVAAYYITRDEAGRAFDTYGQLSGTPYNELYSGGKLRAPTRNDYCIVLSDETHGNAEYRYIFAVAEDDQPSEGQWEPQYPIETNDYVALSNKPKINNVELAGNISLDSIGAVPTSRTINGKKLTSNITLYGSDIKTASDNSTTLDNAVTYTSKAIILNKSGQKAIGTSIANAIIGGSGNDVTQGNGLTFGTNNTVRKGSSIVAGTNNSISGGYSLVVGQNNSVGLQCGNGIVAGRYNELSAASTFAFGEYLKTMTSCETAVGRWNNAANGALFTVGNGLSESARSNALLVKDDGKVFIKGVGGYDGQSTFNVDDVATKISSIESSKRDYYDLSYEYTDNGVGWTLSAEDGQLVKLVRQQQADGLKWIDTSNTYLLTYEINGIWSLMHITAAGEYERTHASKYASRLLFDTSFGKFLIEKQIAFDLYIGDQQDPIRLIQADNNAWTNTGNLPGANYIMLCIDADSGSWNLQVVSPRLAGDAIDVPKDANEIQFLDDSSYSTVVAKAVAVKTIDDKLALDSQKQDKLAVVQISAIDSVVDERKTVVKFADGTTARYYVAGVMTDAIRQEWETQVGSYVAEVKLGNGVTSIESWAFANCTSLTSVTIPDSVTNIGDNTFDSCSGLTSVTIGNGVTSIGNEAFEGCDGLSFVVVKGKSMVEVQNMTYYPWGITDTSIIKTWNDASQEWVEGKGYRDKTDLAVYEGGVTTSDTLVKSSQFSNALEPLQLVQYYPDGSVTNKNQLTTGLKYIFDDETNTATVKPFCVIEDVDATNCTKIGKVVIPPYVDKQGNISLRNDDNMYEVTAIGDDDIDIGDVYQDNNILTHVVAPTTVVKIGNTSFANCEQLSAASFTNVTSIGTHAFDYCQNLQTIDIHSVSCIEEQAFANCTQLEIDLDLPEAKKIGYKAFFQCYKLKSVSLPKATSIGNSAFNECANIKKLHLQKVESIGNSAFYNCIKLTFVDFGSVPHDVVPSCGTDAFVLAYGVPCTFVIPADQYDDWIEAVGWSSLFSNENFNFVKSNQWQTDIDDILARILALEKKVNDLENNS